MVHPRLDGAKLPRSSKSIYSIGIGSWAIGAGVVLASIFSSHACAELITLSRVPSGRTSSSLVKSSEQLSKRSPRRLRERLAEEFDSGITISWNDVSRSLIIATSTPPPKASRLYALVSVAQNDAAYSANFLRSKGTDASTEAAISEASFNVLSAQFPTQERGLKERHERAIRYIATRRSSTPESIAKGRALGRSAASAILLRAQSDGASLVWSGAMPSGEGIWKSLAPTPLPPLLPRWGEVKPWFLVSGALLRPPPPPSYSTQEFQEALAEVRRYSDTRTNDLVNIVKFWADGAGTFTPPGHWNQIASDFMKASKTSESKAAEILAALNMALMDAGICCWDAKYAYWLLRPSQADPLIIPAITTPNFPAYTSGHATFSGAAAEVLGKAFPSLKPYFLSLASEAALSRLYGGIHYRFDSDVGLESGRIIGAKAADWLDTGKGVVNPR
jgi:PAP2 superfamily